MDREWENTPHRWNIRMIRNFMITFGLVSSVFDFITFWALLRMVGKVPELFRTGWFVESLLTELLITLVVRTYRPFYKSRPGRFLFLCNAGSHDLHNFAAFSANSHHFWVCCFASIGDGGAYRNHGTLRDCYRND